ncbi:hypothetical protein BC834DRAFT_71243 [Gloeopeniophorella convolvens]|nr:hypothetical protein BC834DRAFT_71243 [Gloeopeniophorella convolvens]
MYSASGEGWEQTLQVNNLSSMMLGVCYRPACYAQLRLGRQKTHLRAMSTTGRSFRLHSSQTKRSWTS